MSLAFKVYGLDCAEEVALLKREVGPAVGGEQRLSFDILHAKMVVSGPDATAAAVITAVERTGMRAEVWRGEYADASERSFWDRHRRAVLAAVSGAATLAALLAHAAAENSLLEALGVDEQGGSAGPPVMSRALYGVAIVVALWFVLPKAWLALRRVRLDMNVLMTLAVAGAISLGEWFEAASVSLLFSISLLLESWSVQRARDEIASLLNLAPAVARVMMPDGKERRVAPADVAVGSTLIVKPGERLPLDGIVLSGASHVNQAPITGESQPVAKVLGDEVYAGTVNGDGALRIEVTKAAGHTILANIVRMVGEAHSRRAPTERWVERFARVYTPAVIGLALVVFCVPPLLLAGSWSVWFYNALVLLVIACPCALVISTPVTIVSGLAAAARSGVLIKGGEFLEMPARVRAIAFDKTGTLTRGRPAVRQVIPLSGHTEEEVLERAAALELRSEHPLAAAIVDHAAARGIQPEAAEHFQVVQGRGATALVGGRPFWVGSHRYLEQRGQETPEIHQRLEQLEAEGHSVILVGNDEHLCGIVTLSDEVHPDSRAVITELRTLGLERLILLTGDNEPTARAVAELTGADEFQAGLLPADKVAAVERLVQRYAVVAMVGDGVNDAPALARASIGIAMGAAGSDAAIETADVALLSDDLTRLPWLVRHARRTLSILQQNIVLALGIKLAFVALTLVGAATLWSAIAADMGASLLVTLNGLRLLPRGDHTGRGRAGEGKGAPGECPRCC